MNMTRELTNQSKIQLPQEIIYSRIDDEIVLLNTESGKYFKIDEIGSRLWGIIETPIVVKDLCKQLVSEYEVSIPQCERDVTPFLQGMLEEGLLQLAE